MLSDHITNVPYLQNFVHKVTHMQSNKSMEHKRPDTHFYINTAFVTSLFFKICYILILHIMMNFLVCFCINCV